MLKCDKSGNVVTQLIAAFQPGIKNIPVVVKSSNSERKKANSNETERFQHAEDNAKLVHVYTHLKI